MTIFCQEALKDRARALHTDPDHNGIRMVLVSIDGDHALLEVHFYNRNFLMRWKASPAQILRSKAAISHQRRKEAAGG